MSQSHLTIHKENGIDGGASTAMPEELAEVRVLRSVSELEQIRSYWVSWAGHQESGMDSYLNVLTERRESIRPHVIVVFRGGRPDALLAGRLDDMRLDRLRIGYIALRPRVKALYFVYDALRGDASFENCRLIIREVCESLSKGEADLAYLNFLKEDSDIYRLAKELPGTFSRDRVRTSQRHYTATLPRSVDEFHRSLSPKVRKNQRWNKMNRDFPGSVRIDCFQKASEIDSLAEVAEQIAQHSYQRGLGVGFANTEKERRRLRIKAENGWLRAYVLYLGDRPAAFWIGDINDGVFGSDYLGFDPAFSKYSPGMYLILKAIEGFCAGTENVAGLDFATGHAEYKEALCNRVWDEHEVYIFAPSFKGIALNLVKTSVVGINKATKSMLERTGLLQKIKRGWRRHLARQAEKLAS